MLSILRWAHLRLPASSVVTRSALSFFTPKTDHDHALRARLEDYIQYSSAHAKGEWLPRPLVRCNELVTFHLQSKDASGIGARISVAHIMGDRFEAANEVYHLFHPESATTPFLGKAPPFTERIAIEEKTPCTVSPRYYEDWIADAWKDQPYLAEFLSDVEKDIILHTTRDSQSVDVRGWYASIIENRIRMHMHDFKRDIRCLTPANERIRIRLHEMSDWSVAWMQLICLWLILLIVRGM